MAKAKISVTIDESVLKRVDQVSGGTSRSEIVERALKRWLVEGRRRQLEAEIAAYYSERNESEQLEDGEWARLSAAHLKESWK
jgi:metal-responsive CopG/Arc/MetJ family transcriptional regulator